MLTKSERVLFEDRFGESDLPGEVLPPVDEQTYPTVSEVFHEIAVTLASFLAMAAVINVLLSAFGV